MKEALTELQAAADKEYAYSAALIDPAERNFWAGQGAGIMLAIAHIRRLIPSYSRKNRIGQKLLHEHILG